MVKARTAFTGWGLSLACMAGTPPSERNEAAQIERQPVPITTTFRACTSPAAGPFRDRSFGMPQVVGPYTPGEQLRVIRGRELLTFEEEGAGFRFASVTPLPPPVPVDGSEGASAAAKVQQAVMTKLATGYQLGEHGEVYWVSMTALYRHTGQGWKPTWFFPRHGSNPESGPGLQDRGGIVVLPGGRVADFGGEDGFLQIVHPGEDPKAEAKVLATLPYADLHCSHDSYHAQ